MTTTTMSLSVSRLACDFLDRRSTLAWAVLASALSVVGEVLYGELAFVCPCRPGGRNTTAAAVAVVVPCALLFLGGCFLQVDTWRAIRGSCRSCCGRKKAEGDAESGERDSGARVREALLVVFARALVAPMSWAVAALLSGVYYACGQSTSGFDWWKYSSMNGLNYQVIAELLYKLPCEEILLSEAVDVLRQASIRNEVLASLRSESQLVGLGLLAGLLVLAALTVCILRCKSPTSEREASFVARYRAVERRVFADEVDSLARALAEQQSRAVLLHVRAAFEGTADEKGRRQVEARWRELSAVQGVLRRDGGLSALHKCANKDIELTEYDDPENVYAN
ncbi:calcium homeostasis modulator protein 6-like [Lampetra planeri]